MAKKKEEPKDELYDLEARLLRLEEIAEALDEGNQPLARLIALYEEGMSIVSQADELLRTAELRITTIRNRWEEKSQGEA